MAKGVKGFRLDNEVVELLDVMSKGLHASQTDIVEEGVRVVHALLNDALRHQFDDLDLIRRMYDGAERLIAGVFEEDGEAVGTVIIDGKNVDDVKVHPLVVPEEGRVYLYLNVQRPTLEAAPPAAQVGTYTLFLPHARLPLGELPWPVPSHQALVIDLTQLDALLEQHEQAAESAEKAVTVP